MHTCIYVYRKIVRKKYFNMRSLLFHLLLFLSLFFISSSPYPYFLLKFDNDNAGVLVSVIMTLITHTSLSLQFSLFPIIIIIPLSSLSHSRNFIIYQLISEIFILINYSIRNTSSRLDLRKKNSIKRPYKINSYLKPTECVSGRWK